MQTHTMIPDGDRTITLELTVKEAIALSGIRFNDQPQLATVARRKIKQTLDRRFLPETDKIDYHALEV
ncbi:hypothetical protein [Paenibacillus cymbidii]|uniref:hypothetical protein n=1 Tax=Paenibacillus cymbidii TaxID=1639034 RepID=UPI001F16EE6B|nr:hypothetical protein [Paenibacillus cymbidii]